MKIFGKDITFGAKAKLAVTALVLAGCAFGAAKDDPRVSASQQAESNLSQPNFEIFENSIKITLPIIETKLFLTTDEKTVMDILEKGNILSSGEILEMTEFKKDKLNRLLKSLIQKNYIAVTGKGRGTKYFKR